MNMIIQILKEIFNFFCGDWRIFWGVSLTIVLIEVIEHLAIFMPLKPFTGIILIVGISLSLASALKREIPRQDQQPARRSQ
jgi:hypothetical protein